MYTNDTRVTVCAFTLHLKLDVNNSHYCIIYLKIESKKKKKIEINVRNQSLSFSCLVIRHRNESKQEIYSFESIVRPISWFLGATVRCLPTIAYERNVTMTSFIFIELTLMFFLNKYKCIWNSVLQWWADVKEYISEIITTTVQKMLKLS